MDLLESGIIAFLSARQKEVMHINMEGGVCRAGFRKMEE